MRPAALRQRGSRAGRAGPCNLVEEDLFIFLMGHPPFGSIWGIYGGESMVEYVYTVYIYI